MQYQKIISKNTVIEFHNNWLGQETVIVNGQIVSKKSSMMGIHHNFTALEDGKQVRFVLTSKMDMNGSVLLDLRRNGKIAQKDIPVDFGFGPKETPNKAKQKGLTLLMNYDLEEALEEFKKALDVNPEDPEIYFHMACAYSVLEEPLEGFECLKKAVALRLPNNETILNHDMLAFLRMHEAFEGFLNSKFTKYDTKLLK
jgi:tetratricopeptide (TPR) repeat protein